MQTILVTGAAGFIGSNFVRMLLDRAEPVIIVALDRLTYAGNLANISDLLEKQPGHLIFERGDIADADFIPALFTRHAIRQVVNFAAETHVDRSILDPEPFVRTNINGTFVLLEAARKNKIDRFLQVEHRRSLWHAARA